MIRKSEETPCFRVGIDIGGTAVKIGLVDMENCLVAATELPTEAKRPYQEIAQNIGTAVKLFLEDQKVLPEQCRGVGIAIAGTLDPKTNVVVYANNLFWEDVPFLEELKKTLPYPMKIANDAVCAALAEVEAGAAKGYQDALMLTLGTGFGGGVIIDGKIFQGKLCGGTELGHTVIVMDGEECTCGRKGCVEAYTSATALIREGKRAMDSNPDSLLWDLTGREKERLGTKMIFDAAKAGDEAAGRVIRQYQRYLTAAIANFVDIFRPQIVVIGGGMSRQGRYLLDPVNEALKTECFGGDHTGIPPVVPAKLFNEAGIIGAASLF